jgi:hypothetical protein
MTFHTASDLGHVLVLALRGASLHEGRITFSEPAAT